LCDVRGIASPNGFGLVKFLLLDLGLLNFLGLLLFLFLLIFIIADLLDLGLLLFTLLLLLLPLFLFLFLGGPPSQSLSRHEGK